MSAYCKHCRHHDRSLTPSQFICTQCSSEIFPFKHFIDDGEYY